MRTIEEIVEGLNDILLGLADIGCMSDEEIKYWGDLMVDFRVWQECNKVEKFLAST